ncbi:MAG: tRNA (adenosine(37)-N6)-threonylcarbamoyltransferase complex ATPase subunit type 1 TsaE [Opitutales bacterium]|nr:tRNA (adenosine(37)-N6)-threonylcarbamoyltransferase complex ATPase subunit type 1 TsaE [Opitutales bacterium]
MDAKEELKKGFISDSLEDTERVAAAFALQIEKDAFITLSGDLGAGKTAFVRAIAKALGVKAQVKSPSFNICNIYPEGLVHIDAYRIKGSFDPSDFLIDELAATPTIICVEWPEMIADFIPQNAYKLKFTLNGQSRKIVLE